MRRKNFIIPIVVVMCGLILLLLWSKRDISQYQMTNPPTVSVSSESTFDPSLPAGKKDTASTTKPKPVLETTIIDATKMDKNPLLINDLISNRLYLMEKSGSIIFEWPLGERYLGNDATILPDGRLLASKKSLVSKIKLGGYGGVTEFKGSGGQTLWKFEIASTGAIAHHDALLLPNGNILTMVWNKLDKNTAKKYGYTMDVDIYPERIVEIDPKKNVVVWRWDSMDHIIQNNDPKAPNFGDIAKRPERININHMQSQSGMIMHGNGLAYDPKNKLIYMSVYNFSEVWVIDHSTTPEEVKTGKGGKYNRGGDLVYRFGNPSAYGGTGTRLFYSNHHPSFTEDGTFLIYSNGIGANPEQSTAYELRLPKELDETKATLTPPEVLWSYTHRELFYDKVGGVVKAPNGNYILTEGDGKVWEVTPAKELVWTYSAKPGMFWRTYVYPYGSPELTALGIGK